MDLVIDGTHEEQTAVMKTSIIDLWNAVKGNGKPGLEEKVVSVDRRLDKIDSALYTSILWGKIVAGILTLFFLAVTAYFTSLEIRGKSDLVIPKAIHPNAGEVITAQKGLASQDSINNEESRPWQSH